MKEENVFERLKKNSELSSLPQILAEVIRVTSREETSTKELAAVISKDPALSARLLRFVNSPLYGFIRDITTVNQAVVTLGLRSVKAIALSISLYRMFDADEVLVDRVRFWRHSLETAIACREIAKACGCEPAEEAFVTGLFHDLGILLLESNYPVQFEAVWRRVEQGDTLVEVEEEILGTNHARVGRFLMQLWQLPSFMGEAIGRHHDDFSGIPERTDTPGARLAHVTALGNRLSKFSVCAVTRVSRGAMDQIEALSQSLGIGPKARGDIQQRTLEMLIKDSELLQIKIGSANELLVAANSLIFKQYMLMEEVLRDNREMQRQVARDEARKAALESIKALTVTLSHYINNASATIQGRAQVVQQSIEQGTVTDPQHIADRSMDLIVKSVQTISLVLGELKKLSGFDTTQYIDETSLLDIEDRLKNQIERIQKE